MGPSDSVSMSPSAQPAAALAEEFGVRKAVLGGLKEHQSNTGKGKRSEWGPNHSFVPETSAEVGAEWVTGALARAPEKPKSGPEEGSHRGQGTLVEWPHWGLAFGRRWKQSCLSHSWSLKAEL